MRQAGKQLEELYRYRELLFIMAWRDIKVKYRQSVMGVMWAILMPMLIVCAGMMVKYAIAVVSGKPVALGELATVSVKAVPWAFFIGSVRFGTNSLVANQNLVTKIQFPKEIFPVAAVLSCLFDFAVAACVLAAILAIGQVGVGVQLLWLPTLIVVLIMFSMSISVMLSCLNLFLRDVKFIVEVLLTFAIFFTPVLYEVDTFGQRAQFLLMLNPLSPILEGFNSCVVLHKIPDIPWLLYSAGVSFVLLVLSYVLFKNLEPKFAENI